MHGLNTAATLWCSAMDCVPLVRLVNRRTRAPERASVCGASTADLSDTSKGIITPQELAIKLNDAEPEQVVGRLAWDAAWPRSGRELRNRGCVGHVAVMRILKDPSTKSV